MSIREELLAIQQDNEGNVLHCAEVVEWARTNPQSALHSAIEWDNKRAADAHRLWQVRQLIQLHVTTGAAEDRVVSLSIDRKAGGGYRSLAEVGQRPDLRDVMLQDALNELERIQAKYERVQELSEVWRQADVVRSRAGRRRRVTGSEGVAAVA